MKTKNLLLFTAALISMTAFAQDLQTYEVVDSKYGISCPDHFFARNDYDDLGSNTTYDDVVSFKSGNLQLVWIYLDDDAIYENEAIQALTPSEYLAGKPYNEITYNSFQINLYLPAGIEMVQYEDEEGNTFDWQKGDRMPNSAQFQFSKTGTTTIDGLNYDVYTLLCFNMAELGTHFSSKTGKKYETDGCLKKDSKLFGIYLQNNMEEATGRLDQDMIIGQTFLTLKETEDIFFYGTGGNGVENRKMYLHRIALYGNQGFTDEMVTATSISLNMASAEMTEDNTIQLTTTILPSNTTNKTVIWSTSNSSVATVSNNGVVTAISPGTSTITATTTDGSNLSASCVVTVTENLTDYDNYLSMDDVEAFHGDTIAIPVKMTNEASIISFQTDIFLPEGLELLQEDGEYIIDPSERMTRTHSIMSNDISNGSIRVICYSSNYRPFTGNSGEDLFYITVKVADDAEGDYTIQLKNTLFTTSDFVELTAPDAAARVNVKAYLLGDANNSGTVTVTDVVVTSQYVLEMNPQPFIFEAADVNSDGNITVTDVSRIVWMVLNPTQNALLRAPAMWNNGDRFSAEAITLAAGESRRVSILLDNEMDYNAFQFDLNLPDGLTASNFQLTDRASGHTFDVNLLRNGNIRVLCYSPALNSIRGHEGVLLTFDVTAAGNVNSNILVDSIELVTADCQSVKLDAFTIGVNNASSVNESIIGKTIAKVEYFNLAGQRMEQLSVGVTLVVTTYTDGSRTTAKVFN